MSRLIELTATRPRSTGEASMQTRRRFLAGLSLVGAAGLVGASRPLHAEPLPETPTVRLPRWSEASCLAPEYVAENLLRAEGFTDVRYVDGESGADSSVWIAHGEIDFDWNYA